MKIDLSYLDPFREGVNSEFESYGFCVVAHFKLLKFVGWLFLILQLMYLPQCVLNASKGSTNVALTSLSNLVDIRGIGENSTLNGTVAVMYVVVIIHSYHKKITRTLELKFLLENYVQTQVPTL